MSDVQFVEIFVQSPDQPDVARKLLEAAGDAPEQVATVFGGFRVPVALAEAAGYSASADGAVDAQTVEGEALSHTAVAQRPEAAAGVHAATTSADGNEPAAGATHTEATTGAPTEADVLEDPADDKQAETTPGAETVSEAPAEEKPAAKPRPSRARQN